MSRTPKPFSLLHKWTWMCLALDFPGDRWELFLNGEKVEEVRSKSKPLDGKFSNNTELPMVVRIGHYYFDNKPIIGKIVDFHMWTRWEYLHTV